MKQLILIALAILIGLSVPVQSLCAEEPVAAIEQSQKVEPASAKPAWMTGWKAPNEPVQEAGYSMAFGLAACLALLCFGVWIAKKFGLVKVPSRNGGLRVIERTPISNKTNLCLVEARGKQFLIAVGSERVSLISNMSVGDSPASGESFEELLCENVQPFSAC